MKRNARIKDTDEIVEIVSSNLGRCRIRYINRNKINKGGRMVYPTGAMRAAQLEII